MGLRDSDSESTTAAKEGVPRRPLSPRLPRAISIGPRGCRCAVEREFFGRLEIQRGLDDSTPLGRGGEASCRRAVHRSSARDHAPRPLEDRHSVSGRPRLERAPRLAQSVQDLFGVQGGHVDPAVPPEPRGQSGRCAMVNHRPCCSRAGGRLSARTVSSSGTVARARVDELKASMSGVGEREFPRC